MYSYVFIHSFRLFLPSFLLSFLHVFIMHHFCISSPPPALASQQSFQIIAYAAHKCSYRSLMYTHCSCSKLLPRYGRALLLQQLWVWLIHPDGPIRFFYIRQFRLASTSHAPGFGNGPSELPKSTVANIRTNHAERGWCSTSLGRCQRRSQWWEHWFRTRRASGRLRVRFWSRFSRWSLLQQKSLHLHPFFPSASPKKTLPQLQESAGQRISRCQNL
jgi:hypothetical protein